MIDEIINDIAKKLDKKNDLREKMLTKSRTIVHNCGKGIKNIHSGKYKEVLDLINQIKEMIESLMQSINKDTPELAYNGNIYVMYQEFTELCILNSIITKDTFISYQDLNVPINSYLLGLCDVVGELRRYCLDSIRKNKIDDAEKSLKFMDEIFENLSSLNYPNGLVHNLRRKSDVARLLVEKTRADVTMAWVMLRNNKD